MKSVMKKVELSAPSSATVLLTGESGTGKEVIAHALHAFSDRADKPFVPVHCAALNQNLLESELFGHEKGAFTGAAARSLGRFETVGDGTLFLDEIGEISMPTQVKLLRVLENRTFERVGGSEQIPMKARLIAATNRNLAAMVKDGTFREDLFYRLNVVTIEIPPLRKRKEDIPALLDFFLKRNSDAKARNIVAFSAEAVNLLTAYDWPGNVRELRNCVERMTVFSRGPVLTLGDVPVEIRQSIAMQFEQEKNTPASISVEGEALDVKSNEKALILKVLEECNGNRSHAAEKLNISRRTLQRKLREYGLQ
jgi:DNA-binding NtrC family response regulator